MSYADEFVKRVLRLERLSNGEARKIAPKIKSLKQTITDELERLERLGATPKRKAAAHKVIARELGELLSQNYNDVMESTKILIEKEIAFNSDMFSLYSGKEFLSINKDIAFQKILSRKIEGRTFSDWYDRSSRGSSKKLKNIINNGFAKGETVSEISKKARRVADGTSKEIRTLVRSSFVSAANEVRNMQVMENSELFEFKMWVSILDIRTTPHICGIRDGLKYTLSDDPIDHGEPWETGPGSIHFNCRSAWIPKIKNVSLKAERPAINAGENYQRGDRTTNTGRVRKPTRASIDRGIFEVTSGKNFRGKYEGWLRSQPTDYVADALRSRERALRFKKGESLSSITSSPFGEPLNINQL
jgi:SPP1 gp7 family putative phage head morphogenesis protein